MQALTHPPLPALQGALRARRQTASCSRATPLPPLTPAVRPLSWGDAFDSGKCKRWLPPARCLPPSNSSPSASLSSSLALTAPASISSSAGLPPGRSVSKAASSTASPTAPPAGLYDLSDSDVELSDDSADDEKCDVFVDRNGDWLQVMCCDYGFRSGAGRMYQGDTDGTIPVSAFAMAVTNFKQELEGARQCFRFNEFAEIARVSPAANFPAQVAYAVGGGMVQLLAGLDWLLEKVGLFGPVEKREPTTITQENPTPAMTDAIGMFSGDCSVIRQKLSQLKLSNDAVWKRELKREAEGAGVETHWAMRGTYLALCVFLDLAFRNRPIQRFWVLETVARMPYFSYISLLHLYESLGWWRAGAELRKVHFAEEWNELHHLQIMESLGGDQLWIDRFLAQHAAIVYYWVLLGLYFFSPRMAYNFSELIEAHAVDTYGEFVDANASLLKELPPPRVAAEYYMSEDLYMFDEFQTSQKNKKVTDKRRPQCRNLFDVFSNICADEGEHVKTMKACQDNTVYESIGPASTPIS